MCKLLVKDTAHVTVSEIERRCFEEKATGLVDDHQKSSIRVGTADILDKLTAEEPNVDFTWALGADTFIDLASGKWRRTEDIFRMVGYRMIVFRRKEGEQQEKDTQSSATQDLINESVAKLQLVDEAESSIQVVNVDALTSASSSAVRRTTNESDLKVLLTRDVLDYVKQHALYSFGDES